MRGDGQDVVAQSVGWRSGCGGVERLSSVARAAIGRGAVRATQLSGRAVRCPDNGFKPRVRRGAWRPRGSGVLPHGLGAVRGG
jgi:hypothetical protein